MLLIYLQTYRYFENVVNVQLRGPGGLHLDFLEIDFLVVSDREE